MDKNEILKTVANVDRDDCFSFAKNTTYACGGKAQMAFYPKSFKEATAVYDYLNLNHIPFTVLGNGSNVLASDKNYCGAVIDTKRLNGVCRTGESSIFCYAGTTVFQLLKFCQEHGLSGVEYLAGIPATVGGLVLMNAGADGKFISDNVQNILLYNGQMLNFDSKMCNFGYKYSTMRDIKCLVLGVELKIEVDSPQLVKEKIAVALNRRTTQPKGPSCGCVFKNCNGIPAGKIIEEAGLKGLSVGGAEVSSKHANFIINRGGSSADVYALINKVKYTVYKLKGILLEEEVVYIGEF